MAALSDWIRGMASSYPNPSAWREQGYLAKDDVFRFARLWLCEGIPYAFRDNAAAYELAREKFGKVLSEHPKNVSMTGSGRLGYSLAGGKFGTSYDPIGSDIDLFLVSDKWFNELKLDAKLFISRFSTGLAIPRDKREKSFWSENVVRLDKNIRQGFINQYYIPNVDRYKATRACYRACYRFQNTLDSQMSGAGPKKVSVRIYRDWKCAESQIGGSLLYALKENGYNPT